MSLIILAISFIFMLFQPTVVLSSELLIPDTTVNFETYLDKCQQENYTCTNKYFLEQEIQKPTPRFDALIDTIDLENKSFVDSIPKSVQNILQNESINTDQLEMLVRLLDQVQELAKDAKLAKQLSNELKYIQSQLPTEKTFQVNKESFVVFFKKPMSLDVFQKIKKSYLSLPYTLVYFNQVPVIASTNSKASASLENIVTGSCEKASLNIVVNHATWKIISEKSCSWSEGFNKSTAGFTSTIKENKGWLITGAVLIGAAVLASQYEISFQF